MMNHIIEANRDYFTMKTKLFFGFIVVLLALGVAGNYFISRNDQKQPNIILISIDGLQAKHLNSYGYELQTTPNLDSFLSTATKFTNTVSPASWTVPAHMSIFTSLYPSEHKVVNKFSDYDMKAKKGTVSNLKALSPTTQTLAEVLKKEGYVTGGFTGDAGVSAQFGFNSGFDTFYDAETFGGLDGSAPRALEWLRENKDKKFFLFLHGYDVHGQHVPKEGLDYRYVSKPYSGKFTGSKVEQGKLREEGLATGKIDLSDEDVNFWRAVYDEKINRADLELKTFMDQLKEMGLYDTSLIIVFSDHGTELYEHKRFDHGFTLYSELINVLFAVHKPGQKVAQDVDQLVSTIDIMPTVLNLAQIKTGVPQQMKGIDLSPVWNNQNVERTVFSETDYRLYTFKRSIQTVDGWKLILTLEDGRRELYNTKLDPDEQQNLLAENPQKAYTLEQELRAHLDTVSGLRSAEQLGCSPVYGDQCQ